MHSASTVPGNPRDVSNNVGENFDPNSWAIGVTSVVTPGDPIPVDTAFTFTPDVSDPAIAKYVREGLDRGFIWFTLSSLHPALMQAGELISYYTKDSIDHAIDGDLAPSVQIGWGLPLRLATFEHDSTNTVSLSFVGVPGFSYILQVSTDLTAGSWENLETFSSPAGDLFTWQGASPSGKRFFRISRITNISPNP